MPPYAAPKGYGYIALDFMFNTVRGIKGLSVDMRKDKGALKEACDALNELFYKPGIEALRNAPVGPDMSAAFDYDLTLLCHTILNNRQFAEYLWPYMKETFDVLAEKKMTVRLFMEGSSKRFWEYFKDLPKGLIVLHLSRMMYLRCEESCPMWRFGRYACFTAGNRNKAAVYRPV